MCLIPLPSEMQNNNNNNNQIQYGTHMHLSSAETLKPLSYPFNGIILVVEIVVYTVILLHCFIFFVSYPILSSFYLSCF